MLSLLFFSQTLTTQICLVFHHPGHHCYYTQSIRNLNYPDVDTCFLLHLVYARKLFRACLLIYTPFQYKCGNLIRSSSLIEQCLVDQSTSWEYLLRFRLLLSLARVDRSYKLSLVQIIDQGWEWVLQEAQPHTSLDLLHL